MAMIRSAWPQPANCQDTLVPIGSPPEPNGVSASAGSFAVTRWAAASLGRPSRAPCAACAEERGS